MRAQRIQRGCERAKAGMMAHVRLSRLSAPVRLMAPIRETGDPFGALVRQVAQTQDRAAFAALFDHFAPRLKSYLMRSGTPAQQAEELAQEAMLILWRKALLFDPQRASASTWLFTIARNLRIDALRRARRPLPDFDDPALAPPPEEGADRGLEMQQDEAALRRALTLLPPDQNEIVMLSYFSDKPHSEIAAALGIPLGTVKSRLRLAMARLRAAMGGAP